jgi:putative ABC transport system permease protein
LEYGLLGLLTALIASVVGSIAAWAVVTEVMKLEFIFDPFSVITASFIAIAAVLVIGFYGIWRALGQKAGALLRNE